MIFQFVFDEYFRRLTVENLIKNTVRERNVLKFLAFRSVSANLFVNLPVVSPTNNVSSLRAPSISIRMETVIFLLEYVTKLIEDLKKRNLCPMAASTQSVASKPSAEEGAERRVFYKHVRNLRLLKKKYGSIKEIDDESKFKSINLKVCANFLQLKVFCKPPAQKPEMEVTDPSIKSKIPASAFSEPRDPMNPMQNAQAIGMQFVVENTCFEVTLKRYRVS